LNENGFIKMPCDVFLYLSDFIEQHESDILLEMEDFELLVPVMEWINELEASSGISTLED